MVFRNEGAMLFGVTWIKPIPTFPTRRVHIYLGPVAATFEVRW